MILRYNDFLVIFSGTTNVPLGGHCASCCASLNLGHAYMVTDDLSLEIRSNHGFSTLRGGRIFFRHGGRPLALSVVRVLQNS